MPLMQRDGKLDVPAPSADDQFGTIERVLGCAFANVGCSRSY
jgi:hypothetical protein